LIIIEIRVTAPLLQLYIQAWTDGKITVLSKSNKKEQEKAEERLEPFADII
jgi:hypothetical protein